MKSYVSNSTTLILLWLSFLPMSISGFPGSIQQSDFLKKIYSRYNSAQFERLPANDKLNIVLEYGEYLISNKKGKTDLYWMGNAFAEVSKLNSNVVFFGDEKRLTSYSTKSKSYSERLSKAGFDMETIYLAKSR